MSCSCACNKNSNTNFHILTDVVIGDGTSVNLIVTNNSNLANLQPFIYRTQCGIAFVPPTTPVPVTITINGANIPLLDHNGIPITSNNIPRRACGRYITIGATGAPYVILYNAKTYRTLA